MHSEETGIVYSYENEAFRLGRNDGEMPRACCDKHSCDDPTHLEVEPEGVLSTLTHGDRIKITS